MQWFELGISTAISTGAGIGLWAFLPRGVVLTRAPRTQDFRGDPLLDTWEIQNNSALPIHLLSVAVMGVTTFDPDTNELKSLELPCDEGSNDFHGVTLAFDDESLDIARYDNQKPWQGLEIPPGDTLQAHLSNNHSLTIKYRRAGWMGLLERRSLTIHGTV